MREREGGGGTKVREREEGGHKIERERERERRGEEDSHEGREIKRKAR